MSKGSKPRPYNAAKYKDNYDRIFGSEDALRDLVLAYLRTSFDFQIAKDYDTSISIMADLKKVTLALNSLDRLEVALMASRLCMHDSLELPGISGAMVRLMEDATDIAIKFFERKQKVYAEYKKIPRYL